MHSHTYISIIYNSHCIETIQVLTNGSKNTKDAINRHSGLLKVNEIKETGTIFHLLMDLKNGKKNYTIGGGTPKCSVHII